MGLINSYASERSKDDKIMCVLVNCKQSVQIEQNLSILFCSAVSHYPSPI